LRKSALVLVLLLFPSLILPAFSLHVVRAAEDFWTSLEPMPTARSGLGVAVVDGKIYAIGGSNGSYLNVNEMYDPVTDTWTTKAPMPIARKEFGIAVVKNKIYVIGGILLNNSRTGLNQVYDPLTDTWENRTPMPTPRNGLCANVVDDKIYLMGGGLDRSHPFLNPPSNKNEVYDPETDTWITKALIPQERRSIYYASTVLDNKIYIFGGNYDLLSGSTGNLNQVYDPESDTWASAEPASVRFYKAAAGATTGELAPKRIYVFGGYVVPLYKACNLTQIYDSVTDTWATGTPIPTPRFGLDVAVINDELYVIGGATGEGINYLAVNEKYTPIGYIPEFPSGAILPLIIVASLVVVIVRSQLKSKVS
jgi:N-acetylneuraminic acid mutarotase